MVTYNQLRKGMRKPKKRFKQSKWLAGCPQKRAVCMKILTTTPRKPNSAIRKIAKVRITSTGRVVRAFIGGHGHTLQEHSVVMLRAGRPNDLPGIYYKMIRGKYDFSRVQLFDRRRKRSKFSIKLYPDLRKEALIEQRLKHKLMVLEAKRRGIRPPKYSQRMAAYVRRPISDTNEDENS